MTVFWPDGKPAVDAIVSAEPSEATSFPDQTTTDEKGSAIIKLFERYRYIVIARAEVADRKEVHADPVEVLVERDTKPLRFVLNRSGYGDEKVDALKRKPPR